LRTNSRSVAGDHAASSVALLPLLGRAALVAIAYYVTAKLSLRLALVGDNVTPFWPPSGIAVASLFLFTRRIWPAIAVTAFLVNLPISTHVWGAITTAAGNTIAPLIAVVLLERAGFDPSLRRLRDAVSIVWAALLAMTVSATTGVITLLLERTIQGSGVAAAWSVWWAGDAMGVLVIAPVLFTGRDLARELAAGWRRRLEIYGHLLAVAMISMLVLVRPPGLLFVILIPIGVTAWRLGQPGTSPAALIACSLAAVAASHGVGPLDGSLLNRMLTLQSFNVCVALSSFVFAALVTERAAQRSVLEGFAFELENRIEVRTAELSDKNRELERQMRERTEAERALRLSERRLAEAQAIAHLGSWEWNLSSNDVSWSTEMYRIHGIDPAETMSFERVMQLIVEDDAAAVRRNVETALANGHDSVPAIEYHVRRPDGTLVPVLGTGRIVFDDGAPIRMIGTVEDRTDRIERQREHRIADTLQRALLPQTLPALPGVELWAHYAPAESDVLAGGDWYDAVPLDGERLAIVIGDVVGHGIEAASVMAQIRMGVRASLALGGETNEVAERVNRLLYELEPTRMATMALVLLDRGAHRISFTCAGHPRPVLITDEGSRHLEGETDAPLGIQMDHAFHTTTHDFRPGSTLMLFTDGLVDRRGLDLDGALDTILRIASRERHAELPELGRRLVTELSSPEAEDDIAVVFVRSKADVPDPFHARVDAHPRSLAPLRARLTAWLADNGVDEDDAYDVVIACNEAVMNSIEHARPPDGVVSIEGEIFDGAVRMRISDAGTWRDPGPSEKGRGLSMIRAVSDLRISTGPTGTRVSIEHPLGSAR
jgi:PAS domain S-box-containing protein